MKNKKIAVVFIVLFLAAAAAAVFLIAGQEEEIARETSGEDTIQYAGEEYRLNQDVRTILLLGLDRELPGKGEERNPGENGQTDSINLLVTDVEEKTGRILQISRDTVVEIDEYSVSGEKIRTEKGQIALQYAYGDGRESSCRMTLEKVSELLYGVELRDFLALTTDGICVAADALGGVKITVPEDYTYIDPAFSAGAQLVLKGEQAEKYVRGREVEELESNVSRMNRQAQFIQALIGQFDVEREMGDLAELYTELSPYMVTNLSADRLESLAEYEVSEEILAVDGEVLEGEDGKAQFVPDEETLKRLVIELFYEPVGEKK